MKLKWKKYKKINKFKLNKWLKNCKSQIITRSLEVDDLLSNASIYCIYYKNRFIAIIELVYEHLTLRINSLILDPKYLELKYGMAILSDLIKNNVLLTNHFCKYIRVGITSDNHYALILLKSLNFKLDNIYPFRNEFEFLYNLY